MLGESPKISGTNAFGAALVQMLAIAWLAAFATSGDWPGIALAGPVLGGATAWLFYELRRSAVAKGHSGGWGFLALLRHVGWGVIAAFPDRRPEAHRGFEVIVKQQKGGSWRA